MTKMISFDNQQMKKFWFRKLKNVTQTIPLLGIIGAIATSILAARNVGWLESWELSAYDQMMRLRPELTPDNRLLIVEVTEANIQQQQQWPLSDRLIHQVLTNLKKHDPVAIGLDIYRDLPVEPGHAEFTAQISASDRLILVCKESDKDSPGVPAPSAIDKDQVGFADIVVDPGGIVRRGLIFQQIGENSPCTSPLALSFQLARRYLQTLGIEPEKTSTNDLLFGTKTFKLLEPNSGGYNQIDNRGGQILLNYRSWGYGAPSITLDDVLQEKISPEQIKNKIVLIGVTAKSIDDAFYTPFSAGRAESQKMPGVAVHAQLTSQIISAALGERNLLWYWSDWVEIIWICSWSFLGGIVGYRARHPLQLAIAETGTLLVLLGTTASAFVLGAWLPVVPSVLGLIGSSGGVLAYTANQESKERQAIARQIQQQTKDIALLQQLLKERENTSSVPSQTHSYTSHSEITGIPPEAEEDENTAIASADAIWKTSFSLTSSLLAGRYKITEALGAGGFASTYLAQDTHRPGYPDCVVKKLQPAHRDPTFLAVARRLFHTEAEILEKLGNHPHIPRLLAHFETEDQEFYLVEEYIPGQLLSEELSNSGVFDETRTIEMLKEILSILIYIHDRGVIHRDLKPSNIIRDSEKNRLVLIDFGAVKEIQPQDQHNARHPELTVAIGTRGYTPPEQLAGQPNFSSDIYALGVIAINVLTGLRPNQLECDRHTGNLKWRHLVNLSEELAKIIDKMVCYHFVERYQSAAEVLKELP
ncbi:MAG: CHASE2 domain-containing serine/threonine-protein kinase [Oscillatoria sp. PMC 1051.18]|nr:CHASE2 domain-containing serine/threonine-protein kinase [Oscillatoria sp. PMC 1050.18]MEC5029978.1 CHASE2 domain-containing serine/threonine-protein kinase [Oscillatoria sp. PMC 1051.18]